MKIVIVGSGYVGLVSGTCFSEVGIDVVCVDVDKGKIEKLNNGIVPIFEPGLEEMLHRNMKKGRLSFTSDIAEALTDAEVLFIAVGTPPDEDGSADLKYVLSVARDCGKHMKDYLLIATKSTVPVGTARKVKDTVNSELKKRGVSIEFDVASNPEFLKEGAAIEDFLKPDRIVIGLESQRAEDIMKSLYKPFTLNGHPIIFMDITSAEMTKYASNSMLATKISFMNDIANLCEIVGADINMVRKGIGSDSRIGTKFIYPGIGYGGSCFPKDVQALVKTAKEYKYELRVLKAVEAVNNDQKTVLYNKIFKHFKGDLKERTIAVWGLSFKPQTDDMREAPSLVIIKKLLEAGASVKAYDPVAMKEAKHHFGDTIAYYEDQYEALIDADCLALVTEWPEFKFPKFQIIKKLLSSPVIFDGRNIYDRNEMKRYGFRYYCIGIDTAK
ncbi:MAG: UDP-glucose 6-dehydrogenase [Bacteroidetes bacterium GWE2_41_25]|nr:MAG: UDP-glucose 6-dehydrogenase [Bacteroidetes bacterium GWA2_40_15]OFX84058.1 MAG: UDP-glucose 6-dehydrogenase [Bacteroidetes bacterium GWC2_40_22]OFX94220.1 MAG: UDP-glucose 6-dehydrogenase [Bacteroidetes bacterium GWE2_41_25]HBH84187.1 UDP-glucose 6-dehydrogenase [Bacteroidales bacterium]HBQ83713.1 UDP-glucose 6-dehydrogenase [Bacteroidales bacterium]